jgi:hypothetical protein
MTEFVVSAAFVMVPLFIIVPTLAKYIDMKLAAVQAARYASWEYTAHYVARNDQPIGFSYGSGSMPLKKLTDTQKEAKRRFYSNTASELNTNRDRTGYLASEANPLWTYHNGLPMYKEASQTADALVVRGSDPTPDKLKILNFLVGGLGWITNLIADFNAKIGLNTGFDAINPDGNATVDGLYHTRVAMKVEAAPSFTPIRSQNRMPLFLENLNLQMQAKSGLLTETWGAGGAAHTVYQSSGLLLTPYIDFLLNGWGIPLQTIASTILLSPELDKSSLKFGYPLDNPEVMDLVPIDKLENDSRSLSCDGNYCVED